MIEFVSSILMIASVFYGQPVKASDLKVEKVIIVEKEKTTEQIVREYFADTPILIDVARCESTFRQSSSSGKVIRGTMNEYDVGVMQINELYHDDKAKDLGFNLKSLEGNLGYAKWLYEKENLGPWMSSSKCWKKSNILSRL